MRRSTLMNSRRFFFSALITGWMAISGIHYALGQSPELESKKKDDWFAKDTTQRLKKLVSDFRVNYHAFEQEKRAMLATGDHVFELKSGPEISRVNFICVIEKRNRWYIASSRTMLSPDFGMVREYWNQTFVDGDTVLRRVGPYKSGAVAPIENPKERAKYLKTQVRLRPLDAVFSSYASFRSGGPPRGSHRSLTAGVLDSCKYNKDGDIVQITSPEGDRLGWKFEIVWGKESAFYPTRVERYKLVADNNGKTKKQMHSLNLAKWSELKDIHAPSQLSVVNPRSGRGEVFELSLSYKMGSEIPSDGLLVRELDDWREPIRKLFAADWQRKTRSAAGED